jgi:tetratricopeptide (TPR) repeat protein
MRLANEVLNEDFNNNVALFIIGYCLLKAERFGLSYNINRILTQRVPHNPEPWNNMGMCHSERMDLDDAERCFRESLKRDPNSPQAMSNIALIEVNKRRPLKAIEWADKALKINSDLTGPKHNKSLACLMLKRWKEAWPLWDSALGSEHRKFQRYVKEPVWDGSKGKTVIIYGEQGLGDEISFASCIPDVIRDSKQVIIDCDFRLEGLFKRSFPEAKVYGTRFEKTVEWPFEYQIDASCAVGGLPRFYRNSDSDFPGTPYLKADPERRIQWRALLDSLGPEPKIGLAWTGGSLDTGSVARSIDLETLKPLLNAKAHFISLQYKEPPDPKYGIKHWSRATQTRDYDDTAALVAELDLVITVCTSVVHLAGALGVPCWVMVPNKMRWFYCLEGETLPWYKSIRMFRQTSNWQEVVNRVKGALEKDFNPVSH